jgi:hypothetical protein
MTTTGTTLRHHPVAYDDPPLADRERWSPARTECRHRQLELRGRLPGTPSWSHSWCELQSPQVVRWGW